MISANRQTELEGVDFVRAVARKTHCNFQEFSHHNDHGNDCYIEFVENLIPSNYGVFVQVKSGPTFKDGLGYKIPADKSHLAYWSRNLYKTIGIVYDTELSKAFWVDISIYIKSNPEILDQETHNLRVSALNEFAVESFPQFMTYCFQYKTELQSYENLGQSLELFSEISNPDVCFEGFKALYSSHRDKRAAWYYIISNFSKVRDQNIRRHIIGLISNYFNPDIFWHKGNLDYYPTENCKEVISKLLSECFGVQEVRLLLPYMREGISRGSFSYLTYLIISSIDSAHLVIKEICLSPGIDDDDRNFWFWLYMHIAKYESQEETIRTAELYLAQYPSAYNDEAILGLYESVRNGDLSPIG